MFCGGRRCKYESSSNWKNDDVAIEGIYSHWITDDLLAMARPNTENMAKYKTVQQFKTLGIKSIINLQTPGMTNSFELLGHKPIVIFSIIYAYLKTKKLTFPLILHMFLQ